MTLEKGTTLGGYRITGILGQGGMGVVYEAEQMALNRKVALKVLAPHLSDDVLFRERFRREGQLQAGIDHAHIVTVYEAGDSEEGVFIAMRLIRGPNLKDMIVSRELDPGRTLRILTPIAEALDEAHEAGLIHRDIKPQNILVAGRDHAFLADFGLTKAAGEKSLTRTGQFVGTFDYISPEQVKGERATHKSDVYALAAVLYECLTGVVPFPKDSEAAVLYAQMADPPPTITDQRPELPASLDDVIARGMAKDPAQRYDSCGQLLLETSRTFTHRTRAAFTPPRPIEVPEETGIRPAESEVPTREAPAEDREPETEPVEAGEPAPDLTVAAAPDVTVPSPAPPTAPGTPAEAPATALRDAEAATTRASESAPAATAPAAAAATEPAATAATTEPATAATTGPATAANTGPATAATLGAAPTAATTEPASAGAATGPGVTAPTRALPARPRGGLGRALLGLSLLAIVVVAGLLLGRATSGSDEATPAASKIYTERPLELSYPDGWQRVEDPPAIEGLTLRNPIVVSEGGVDRDALLAGTTNATGPSLLPAAFLNRLGETPARDDAVRTGELEAYRYRDLRPDGFEGTMTLYVAPTTEGVVTVACAASSPRIAKTFLPACEEVAGGLKLIEGEPVALGADQDYLAKLNQTFERLNGDRRREARTLRSAKTQAGQAKAAASLSQSYRRARRSLRGQAVSPVVRGADASLRAALAITDAAYGRLAVAARRGNRGQYEAVRKNVAKAEKAVKNALRQVRAASE